MSQLVPNLFDSRVRVQRQSAASDAFLWHEAAEGILARLLPVTETFATALAVDGRANALLPRPEGWISASFDENERLTGTEKANLAVSILSLHGINDLPGALRQIRQRIEPGGLFLAALFGGQTLFELRDSIATGEAAAGRQAMTRIAPFADVRDLGRLLVRAGFAFPVADVERTRVRYRTADRLLADLRQMGERGILPTPRPFLSKSAVVAARNHYAAGHSDADGKLRATFDIVYLTGWVPDKNTLRRKLVSPRTALQQ